MASECLVLFDLPEIKLTPGLVIDHSCRVKPGVYRLANTSEDGRAAAIFVRGKGVVVDFSGAVLEGSSQDVEPDLRAGTGIKLEGSGITLLGAKVRGYKVAVLGDKCEDLRIIDSDFSYNWKQHLKSTSRREDEGDWQSYHHNEKDEWFLFGAGLYLRDCTGFEVRGVTAVGGNCGVMLTRSNSGLVWNSTLSYLSGIGLGLYRSSNNRVMHNRIDYCVRGYSHNVYNRGQDSAGILVYEQSNGNTFAYNSVTHGGDGFFLWAGQSTMDTGKGGCNDNLLYGNDFSHAVTNGIEATFSRNIFFNNLLQDCWHGVWGGYSSDSSFIGNYFKKNVVGMAVEHGQSNSVTANVFNQDGVGLQIWANATQGPDWGYPKNRDTASKEWTITCNTFIANNEGVNLVRTKPVKADDNTFEGVAKPWVVDDLSQVTRSNDTVGRGPANAVAQATVIDDFLLSDLDYSRQWSTPWVSGYDGSRPAVIDAPTSARLMDVEPQSLPKGNNPFLPGSVLQGRRFIHVDEWGPDDGKYPRLWLRSTTQSRDLTFDVTGPSGSYRVVKAIGLVPEQMRGTIGTPLMAKVTGDFPVNRHLNLSSRERRRPTIRASPIPQAASSRLVTVLLSRVLCGMSRHSTLTKKPKTPVPNTKLGGRRLVMPSRLTGPTSIGRDAFLTVR